MTTKIFVRERRKVEKGEKKPRFRVVGVSGAAVRIYVNHMRRKELEQVCAQTGAQAVFLESGEGKKDGGGRDADAETKP
jgi:hypothetical protein